MKFISDNKIIIIVVLLIVIMTIIGFFVDKYVINKNEDKNKKNK